MSNLAGVIEGMTTRVRLSDGAETIVETWGEREPILLAVHGMASSRKSWERLAQHVAGRYRVVAYDQRGHGDSANVEGSMALTRACQDFQDVVASLGEPIDSIAGHSWGGAVALIEGRKMQPRRVVAIDPMIRQNPDIWYDEFLEDLRVLFSTTGDARAARVREEFADWPEIDREGKIHAVATMTTRPIEGLRAENPAATWDLRNAVASYPVPLLLAMADPNESIVDAADLTEIQARGGSNVRVTSFKNQGHNLHRTGFTEFSRSLDAFL